MNTQNTYPLTTLTRSRPGLMVILLVASGGLAGCGKTKPPENHPDPKLTIQAMQQAVTQKDLVKLYQLLPDAYRAKVQELTHQAIAQADAEVWNQSIAVLSKACKVLPEKKELLWPTTKDEAPPALSSGLAVDRLAGVLQVLLSDPALANHDQAKKLNIEQFLSQHSQKIFEVYQQSLNDFPDDQKPLPIDQMIKSIEVQSVSGKQAECTLKTRPGDKRESFRLVFVDGKWVPQTLDQYYQLYSQLLSQMVKAPKTAKPDAHQQTLKTLKALDQTLDKIKNAKTRQDVSQAIESLPKQWAMMAKLLLPAEK